ncbi:hypothetical protein ACRE_045710 [Hapsidospora chrysogenum ATCC 11550]|uniref:Uncharacterized protein n=1 Tax=Hapsidospora chrysogenum (strain ATCC 11550 / CBS 779.69 / DSM 880 / IAM 14645 / JCM 23072 / IMI 49137) TaxID=857340 RepID=A0A086T5J2_HAPC1|nr:hypothetical protein ACRE_045710 [Hapsidospora chrysogenum ATCC 11550]
MSSSSRQSQHVVSDAASQITLTDKASTYSKAATKLLTETLTDAARGFKANMLDRLQRPRAEASTKAGTEAKPLPKADPLKNWEARHAAFLYRA